MSASSSSSICLVVCRVSVDDLFDIGTIPLVVGLGASSLARLAAGAYLTTNVGTILRQFAIDSRASVAGRRRGSPSCHGVPASPRRRSLPLQRRWPRVL